jgi:hypothetical protein
VRAREGREAVSLEKVEHALAVEIGDDADVVPEVEAVAQMDAFVAVAPIVGGQRREDPEFDATSIAVFLHRPDDLDGASGLLSPVVRLDHLSERALAQELDDFVCRVSAVEDARKYSHRSVRVASGSTR